ncbi:MAG TPA: hypothetical protein VGO45_01880 [Bacteroidia bacterium]|nr:hypothetical protein [Bacteroidia bacterium]
MIYFIKRTLETFLSILLFLFATTVKGQNLNADAGQKFFYCGLQGSYAFTGFGMREFFPGPFSSRPNSQSTTQVSYSSLGMGPGSGLYAGYMFTKCIGAELDLNALIRSQCTYQGNAVYAGYGFQSELLTFTASMIRIIPTLRLQLNEDRWHTVSKAGLIIGIPVQAREEEITVDSTGTHDDVYAYKGHLSWGFMGALGVTYDVGAKISIGAELTAMLHSWAPYKLYGISSVFNGVNVNPQSTGGETVYASSYNPSSRTPGNGNYAPKTYFPFSSLGLTISVQYWLEKKK